jgi:hypothetical protein
MTFTATQRARNGRAWKKVEVMLDGGREIDALIEAKRLATEGGRVLPYKTGETWSPTVSRILTRLTPLLAAARVTGRETAAQFEVKIRAAHEAIRAARNTTLMPAPTPPKTTPLRPGAYVVVIDPKGEIAMPGGLRARVLHEKLDSSDPDALAAALKRAEQERHAAEMQKIADEMQSKREAVSRVLLLLERERTAPGGHGSATLYDLYQEIADAFALRAPDRRT